MGCAMARNLQRAGYQLRVHNRTKAKAAPLLAEGAIWCESVAELAAESDIVISIVGYPVDVRQVYLGDQGLIANARPGTILIDMTTSNPSLARLLHQTAEKRGVKALDAPVSGGDIGARDATLAIMVGGDADAFDAVLPVFEAMGKTIRYMGEAGSGQHTKMVNQTVIASTIVGVAEGLAYAKKCGLDAHKVLEVIGTGAAASTQLAVYGPRILNEDYDPGFYVHHFLKDIGIALDEAEALGLDLPGLVLSRSRFEELSAFGYGDEGTQAIARLYDQE